MTNLAKRSSVYSGVLSNVETRSIDGLPVLVGDLTKTIKGEVVVTTIIAGGETVANVRDMFVEGSTVRFYGVRSTAELGQGENPNRFVVIGPDLTKKTLLGKAAVSETQKTKKPRSPAQIAAWKTFRARFRTKKAAEPVAA